MCVFPIEVTDSQRGSYAIYTDVTGRVDREENRRQGNDPIEQLFAQVPTHLYIKDEAGRHLWISDYFDDAPDLTEARGKTDRELYPGRGDETHADDMRVIETGEPISNKEEYLPSFDHWNLTSKVPWYDDAGEIQGLIGVTYDISERKEYERRLREEQEFVEQALNAVDDIFYVITPDGEFDQVSERACEVTGYSEDELLSMEPGDFFDAPDRERVERDVREAFETGSAVLEADLVTKDGETIPYEFRKHRLTGPDGDVIGVAGIGRDVTDRKQRERELEQRNERLDEFTSIVSHNLQNPLSVAQGRLELARADCTSEHLDDVADALDRMDSLIEELLTLAKEGDKIGDTEPISLADVVESCWRTVDASEATLVVAVDRAVRADRPRLQQLLENLLRNAVEHAGGPVTVTVGGLADGFYVEDDGPGIPEKDRNRVLNSGYSTGETGTGLGLSIVEQIAGAHGWTVTVTESDEGGARFEITDVELER